MICNGIKASTDQCIQIGVKLEKKDTNCFQIFLAAGIVIQKKYFKFFKMKKHLPIVLEIVGYLFMKTNLKLKIKKIKK